MYLIIYVFMCVCVYDRVRTSVSDLLDHSFLVVLFY